MKDSGKEHYNILLVDDDEEYVFLLKRILAKCEGFEFSLSCAKGLEESCGLSAETVFDAVLLDFYLGGETASDFMKLLPFALQEVPIIVLTGRDSNLVEEASFGLGVDFFLSKDSLDHNSLARTIKYAIRNSEQQNRLRNFSRLVAHDLKGPIGNIEKAVSTVSGDLKSTLSEEHSEFMDLAQYECNRVIELIRELQSYSISQSGEMRRESISLDGVLDQALANIQLNISKRNVEISRDPLPNIDGDSSLLVHVLQNVIQNGIKYNRSKHPRISISSAVRSGFCFIEIQDNGIGIEREYVSQIFLPMRRLHGNSEFEGTGLGLAICKEIVERHGGRIWVESTGVEGEGSEFTIQLPFDEEDSQV